jgi:hypothetical protein
MLFLHLWVVLIPFLQQIGESSKFEGHSKVLIAEMFQQKQILVVLRTEARQLYLYFLLFLAGTHVFVWLIYQTIISSIEDRFIEGGVSGCGAFREWLAVILG